MVVPRLSGCREVYLKDKSTGHQAWHIALVISEVLNGRKYVIMDGFT